MRTKTDTLCTARAVNECGIDAYIATLRDHAGNPVPKDSDLIVPCLYCGIPAGHWCQTMGRATVTFGTTDYLHKVRRDDAQRLREKGEIRSDKGWAKVSETAQAAPGTQQPSPRR